MTYDFLVLALLFAAPGAVVFALRPDLRPVIGWMALCSLPFAATEFLFYPEYWEPTFLFDLADRIGFGIEDVVFVAGLAAFTSTSYAFFFRARYAPADVPRDRHAILRRAAVVLGATFVFVALVALAGIPMIYGSVVIMLGMTGAMCAARPDLWFPCLLGAVTSTLTYGLLCAVFLQLIPEAFEMTWHTEKFLNVFVLGIPIEELLYGFGAGFAATGFYPYVTGQRFTRAASRPGFRRGRCL